MSCTAGAVGLTLTRLKASGPTPLVPPHAFLECTGTNLHLTYPYISFQFPSLFLFLPSLLYFFYTNFSFSLFPIYSYIFFLCYLALFHFYFSVFFYSLAPFSYNFLLACSKNCEKRLLGSLCLSVCLSLSVRLPVYMEQLSWYLTLFLKSVETVKFY